MSSNEKNDNAFPSAPIDYNQVGIKKSHATSYHSHLHLPHLDTVSHDLKKFSNIFNSYATKKTFATGFFNLALVG